MLVIICIAVALGLLLGIWWLIWLLWCWVMPQLWSTGPEVIISPDYWLFCGAWLLASLIGNALFKGGSGK